MSNVPGNQTPVLSVRGEPGDELEAFVARVREAVSRVDPSLPISTDSVSAGEGTGPIVSLRQPDDIRLVFKGPRSDYELQVIALAVRARAASAWFESTLASAGSDPIPLLRHHDDQQKDDYLAGFLLAQFDSLREEKEARGDTVELLDIVRPAWLRGNPTSAMFITLMGAAPGRLVLHLGMPVVGAGWAWQYSIDVSRSTEIAMTVHEVPSTNVPIEQRQFVSLSRLSDDNAPDVQMLFLSQDFERLVNIINRFRRNEVQPSTSQSAALQDDDDEPQLTPEEALTQALAELEDLVGLSEVKQAVVQFTNYMKVARQRQEAGIDPGDISTHFVFTGSPGTGKTTVARLIAKILYGLGMLSGYETHEVLRSDLVAGFVGQTAIKTREVVEKADGGVLFIDEAYSLTGRGDGQDYGSEAVETLLAEMENRRDDLCVIVAGYQDKMEQFLSSNPGLRSRFSRTLYFPDYSADELVEIFRRNAESKGLILGDGVAEKVHQYFIKNKAQEQFGNARAVRQLLEDAVVLQANRVASIIDTLSRDELQTIVVEDISTPNGSRDGATVDEAGLADSLASLDNLVGLTEVKERIKSFVDLARAQIKRRDAGLPNQDPTLTFVFSGPSGTGKTTVANLLGRIFLNLGLLRRGHTIVTTRADMVAGFVGQTAIKTREQVGRALDGVLFVDEAYALTPSGPMTENDFGKEAIQELLTQMENNRDRLAVIFAGYENEMNQFLNSNPGLRNRIGEVLVFPSYSPDDLCRIVESFAKASGYSVPPEVNADLKAFFASLLERDNGGQARAARTLLDDAIRLHARRLAGVENPTADELQKLSINDFRVAMGLAPIEEPAPVAPTTPAKDAGPEGNSDTTDLESQLGGEAPTSTQSPSLSPNVTPPIGRTSGSPTYVIDGSNVATEAGRALYGERVCSLSMLREARDQIKLRFRTENVVVVVDATFRHRVHESEREDANAAVNNHEFSQPPSGAVGAGDALLLQIADSTDAIVISNDSFNKPGEPFITQYPWLLNKDRVMGHNFVPGVGWIFTPRQLR